MTTTTTSKTKKSGKFNGLSLGHRLYISMTQYIEDIDGEKMPLWYDLSAAEKGAWETRAITETMSVVEPVQWYNSKLKSMELND